MGTLLKAAFGFFAALWILHPEQMAAHFDTPRFQAVKAELAAERPAGALRQDLAKWLNGTAS